MRLTRLSSGGGPPVYPSPFIGLDPGNSRYNVPIRITPRARVATPMSATCQLLSGTVPLD
jgi:hypothetical protein